MTNITEGTYSFIYCEAGDPGIRANNSLIIIIIYLRIEYSKTSRCHMS